MRYTTRIQVGMADEMLEDLEAMVDSGELSRAGIVREAVANYLAADRMLKSRDTTDADRVILSDAIVVVTNHRVTSSPVPTTAVVRQGGIPRVGA